MNTIDVKIEKMYPDVEIPVYQTSGSAGCDIRAYIKTEDGTPTHYDINPGMRGVIIPTGLKISVPIGFYIAVVPRSGLSLKTTMRISNSPGIIDSDYFNEINIICDNTGEDGDSRYGLDDTVTINHNDRIAQLLFLPYYQAKFNIVEKLEETNRKGGMGSTGIK